MNFASRGNCWDFIYVIQTKLVWLDVYLFYWTLLVTSCFGSRQEFISLHLIKQSILFKNDREGDGTFVLTGIVKWPNKQII